MTRKLLFVSTVLEKIAQRKNLSPCAAYLLTTRAEDWRRATDVKIIAVVGRRDDRSRDRTASSQQESR